MLGYKEEMLFAEDKYSSDVHVSLEDSNTIKVRNENVCAKGGVAPSERRYEKITYDLVMCNVVLQIHRFN